MRGDLPLGTLAAQLAHASGESYSQPSQPLSPQPPVHVVVLAVCDERALERVRERLRSREIGHVSVYEPDLEGELTALGLHLVDAGEGRARIRKVLSNLPLLRELSSPSDHDDEVRCACGALAEHWLGRGWACTRSGAGVAQDCPHQATLTRASPIGESRAS